MPATSRCRSDAPRRVAASAPSPNAAHTDASYHLPAFYEVWARVGPQADRAFWSQAAQVSRDYFSRAAHPRTALTPDYGNFDGTPWAAAWRPESVDFRAIQDGFRAAMAERGLTGLLCHENIFRATNEIGPIKSLIGK